MNQKLPRFNRGSVCRSIRKSEKLILECAGCIFQFCAELWANGLLSLQASVGFLFASADRERKIGKCNLQGNPSYKWITLWMGLIPIPL